MNTWAEMSYDEQRALWARVSELLGIDITEDDYVLAAGTW